MPPLRVPARHRAGLSSVDLLTDADIKLLESRLDVAGPDLSFDRLAAQARPEISSDIDLKRLFEAVASLLSLLPEDGSGAETLANEASESEDLGIPAERRSEYAARLRTLMGIPSLAIASRAMEVMSEHDKVFHDARILTDVRPVFGRQVSDGPRAAGMVATLKVEYHPGGRNSIESLFIALDRGDLEHLARVVNRALDKMNSLSKLLESSRMPRWTSTLHTHDPS